MIPPLPVRELDWVLDTARKDLQNLASWRILLTGGTGFIGRWLVETWLHAHDSLDAGGELHILSRDPEAFLARAPHLRHPALRFHPGSLAGFPPIPGPLDAVVHAGAAVGNLPGGFLENLEGTARVLALARESGAQRLLFTSSGAVYGPQPPDLPGLPETFTQGPDPLSPASGYAEGKRAAEYLCSAWSRSGPGEAVLARCFTFLGPGLPLDGGFAAGNFIRDALEGVPIRIKGDGTAVRSYLYAADLATWLWILLGRGEPGRAYNIGAGTPVTILDLAQEVARLLAPGLPVQVEGQPAPGLGSARYVPDVSRIRGEFGLVPRFSLAEGILRTADWWRAAGRGRLSSRR